MAIRASLAGWMMLTAVLALSAGAVAGSGEARRAGMEAELARLRARLAERDALVGALTAELARYRDRVDTARMETQAVQAALRTHEAFLRDANERLALAEETIDRQRRDLELLKRCLTGSLHALRTLGAGGDGYGAMAYMMNVDGECRAVQGLLNLQTAE